MIRLLAAVVGLFGLTALFFVSRSKGATDQGADTSQRPETPLMTWHGESEVGYLRVELWNRPTADARYNQDLVVKSTSRAFSATYSGVMVDIPYELKTEPNVRQLFIRVSDDGVYTSNNHQLSLLATLSNDGILHLYECGMRTLSPPCVLHPIE